MSIAWTTLSQSSISTLSGPSSCSSLNRYIRFLSPLPTMGRAIPCRRQGRAAGPLFCVLFWFQEFYDASEILAPFFLAIGEGVLETRKVHASCEVPRSDEGAVQGNHGAELPWSFTACDNAFRRITERHENVAVGGFRCWVGWHSLLVPSV